MKSFKMIGMALIAMTLSFNLSSCDDNDDDNFIAVDYSKDLVGTWTCFEPGYAGALVINADGSAVSTILQGNEFRKEVKGTVKVENNKISLNFEDDHNFDGRFEIISNETLSVVDTKTGERITYRYCEQDLSQEILGMWVFNVSLNETQRSLQIIYYFNEDGTVDITGAAMDSDANMDDSELHKNDKYLLIGDLLITPSEYVEDGYMVMRLDYFPNQINLGEIMQCTYVPSSGKTMVSSMLKVKQYLELPGQKYNYIKTYVTNASGKDEDFTVEDINFNFSKLDGTKMDKMLKTLLFNVEFPSADTIKYNYIYNGETVSASAPIEVEGNKMTVKMDKSRGCFRDMDLYVFQDKDNTQMHIYMSKYAFINYFGNIAISLLAEKGDIDPTNKAEADAIFNELTELIKTINISFIMTK